MLSGHRTWLAWKFHFHGDDYVFIQPILTSNVRVPIFIYLSICLSVFLSFYLSIYLSFYISLSLYMYAYCIHLLLYLFISSCDFFGDATRGPKFSCIMPVGEFYYNSGPEFLQFSYEILQHKEYIGLLYGFKDNCKTSFQDSGPRWEILENTNHFHFAWRNPPS